jgi:hypothetical protein
MFVPFALTPFVVLSPFWKNILTLNSLALRISLVPVIIGKTSSSLPEEDAFILGHRLLNREEVSKSDFDGFLRVTLKLIIGNVETSLSKIGNFDVVRPDIQWLSFFSRAVAESFSCGPLPYLCLDEITPNFDAVPPDMPGPLNDLSFGKFAVLK